MVSLVDAVGKTSINGHVSQQTFLVLSDLGKNLDVYISCDVGKFYRILSCNMKNFHEFWLQVRYKFCVGK